MIQHTDIHLDYFQEEFEKRMKNALNPLDFKTSINTTNGHLKIELFDLPYQFKFWEFQYGEGIPMTNQEVFSRGDFVFYVLPQGDTYIELERKEQYFGKFFHASELIETLLFMNRFDLLDFSKDYYTSKIIVSEIFTDLFLYVHGGFISWEVVKKSCSTEQLMNICSYLSVWHQDKLNLENKRNGWEIYCNKIFNSNFTKENPTEISLIHNGKDIRPISNKHSLNGNLPVFGIAMNPNYSKAYIADFFSQLTVQRALYKWASGKSCYTEFNFITNFQQQIQFCQENRTKQNDSFYRAELKGIHAKTLISHSDYLKKRKYLSRQTLVDILGLKLGQSEFRDQENINYSIRPTHLVPNMLQEMVNLKNENVIIAQASNKEIERISFFKEVDNMKIYLNQCNQANEIKYLDIGYLLILIPEKTKDIESDFMRIMSTIVQNQDFKEVFLITEGNELLKKAGVSFIDLIGNNTISIQKIRFVESYDFISNQT